MSALLRTVSASPSNHASRDTSNVCYKNRYHRSVWPKRANVLDVEQERLFMGCATARHSTVLYSSAWNSANQSVGVQVMWESLGMTCSERLRITTDGLKQSCKPLVMHSTPLGTLVARVSCVLQNPKPVMETSVKRHVVQSIHLRLIPFNNRYATACSTK